jgi:hypothetical protein
VPSPVKVSAVHCCKAKGGTVTSVEDSALSERYHPSMVNDRTPATCATWLYRTMATRRSPKHVPVLPV